MTSSRHCVHLLLDRHLEAGLDDKEVLIELGSGGRRSLTYGQLHRETHRMARRLRERCSGDHPRLLIVGSSTLETVTTWLAAMRAGLIVCLARPGESTAFYRTLWRNLKPDLVLTDWTARHAGGDSVPEVRTSTRQLDVIDPSTDEPVQSGSEPAVALMTSGTTGGPRVCLHAHRAFADFEHHVTRNAWQIGPDDRVLGSSGPYFSFGLQGIHVPLSVGATAVLVPKAETHADFLDAIQRERVSVFLAVPTLFHLLWRRAGASRSMPSLRLSLSAGEHLPPLVRTRWQQLTGSEMLDSIGTTETFLPYFSEYAGEGEGLQRVDGFRYRFRRRRRTSEGETFSVALSSRSMMLGYWDPEVGTPTCSRWFQTNDLFTSQRDRYRFAARDSEMVKVGGLWVRPQQLEDALLKCAGVTIAAAVPVTTEEGLTRLRAVVVLASALTSKALKPDRIVVVSGLPTTASGKLLRRVVQEQVRERESVTSIPAPA
jgi:4-hydroxybenzoate-CoA ligase